MVKDRPVNFIIGSRDVIHDVGLTQFRMKMDAVPGTPTIIWFTPMFTTKEMKEKINNPDFEYELSCDQMCGNGHFSMKGIIEVVTQDEFDVWMAQQKPNYYTAFPDKDPSGKKPQLADSKKAQPLQKRFCKNKNVILNFKVFIYKFSILFMSNEAFMHTDTSEVFR